jgi:hypothetical protein
MFSVSLSRGRFDSSLQEAVAYLNAVPLDKKEDPLAWWTVFHADYPTVAILARKYLAIPASSASSERVFSKVKLLYERQRFAMKARRLEVEVFLNCNKSLWEVYDERMFL